MTPPFACIIPITNPFLLPLPSLCAHVFTHFISFTKPSDDTSNVDFKCGVFGVFLDSSKVCPRKSCRATRSMYGKKELRGVETWDEA